jgi:hypothetical protein
MMYQDTFIVPAELWLFIIEKRGIRIYMTNWNWTKYDYLCTDCDALIEITTLKNIREWRGWCSCGSANIINIGVSDGNAPLFEPVMKVTPPELVKINTNPYT